MAALRLPMTVYKKLCTTIFLCIWMISTFNCNSGIKMCALNILWYYTFSPQMLWPVLIWRNCKLSVYFLPQLSKCLVKRPCLFTLEEAITVCERSLIWIEESVRLTSDQWQQFWCEFLRISWTFSKHFSFSTVSNFSWCYWNF